MTDMQTLKVAQEYLAAGLSILKVKTDGSKAPDGEWSAYQMTPPTQDTVRRWYSNGASYGIGIIGGKVSGGVEVIDFDTEDLLQDYRESVESEAPGLIERLVRIRTPRPGRHFYYRCDTVEGNQKLAQRKIAAAKGDDGAVEEDGQYYKVITLIETRGEGGMAIAPGSPPECHPLKQTYQLLRGSLTDIPKIIGAEREILLRHARALNEYVPEITQQKKAKQQRQGELRPGDDFNQRGDARELLRTHGWKYLSKGKAGEQWARPGVNHCSATLFDGRVLYVFSTNAHPFDNNESYPPFSIYALLEHNGDFKEATKALAKEGYGSPLSNSSAKKAGTSDNDTTKPEPWEPPAPFHEYTLPSFPTETLPPWLRSIVEGLAQATQTPVDLSAMLSLSACAAAVARNVRIMARPGWSEPLNIYVAAALLPALRKSTVTESITRPLSDYEHELIEEKREKIAEAVNDYRILEARLEKAQKDCAKLEGAEFERRREEARELARELATTKQPVSPQLLCDDVTPEALSTLLAEQGGRIALFSAEGGVFEIMAGRYSNGSANFEVYLKAHPGDSLRVNRRGRAEHVKAPALTIGLAVQPDVIRGLAEKPGFRGRGLVGRFLYVLPPSNLGRRKVRAQPLADEIGRTYAKNLIRLACIEAHGEDPDQARLIRLSPEADDSLAAFEAEIEPKLAEDGELGAMGDWAGKLAGAVLRIAGLLHLVDHAERLEPWPSQVSAATLRRAIAIGRYLIPHARAAYAEMGADPKIEAAQYLLRWIEREVQTTGKMTFTKRDIHRGCRGRFKTVNELEPALLLLEDHGYLRDSGKTQARSIRPSHIFQVNPLWAVWDKQDKQDKQEPGDSQLSHLSRLSREEQSEISTEVDLDANSIQAYEPGASPAENWAEDEENTEELLERTDCTTGKAEGCIMQ